MWLDIVNSESSIVSNSSLEPSEDQKTVCKAKDFSTTRKSHSCKLSSYFFFQLYWGMLMNIENRDWRLWPKNVFGCKFREQLAMQITYLLHVCTYFFLQWVHHLVTLKLLCVFSLPCYTEGSPTKQDTGLRISLVLYLGAGERDENCRWFYHIVIRPIKQYWPVQL